MQQFEQEIQDLITEREDILFEIERVLFTKRYKLAQKHLNIFAVQSVSMIYAIWEGFIQQSFEKYIAYINLQGVEFGVFSTELKVFHMENTFRQFVQYPQKDKYKAKFYDNLALFYAQTQQRLYPKVNTQSNVGFEELNAILKSFCLAPFPDHWEIYKHPNPNLKEILKTFLRYRNGVAHGGDISSEEKITQDTYAKYKKLVIDLMYAISEKMMEGITNQTYLYHNRPQ